MRGSGVHEVPQAGVNTGSARRVERFGTVVIGAGQAGLAVGHHLAAHDADFVIVSDEARVGDNWRRRWDSLRLFTPARHSGLPGMPFPAPNQHLPDKDEVAEYLERYADRFDLPIRLATRVRRISCDGARYQVSVLGSSSIIEADSLVVATGAFQQPRVPAVASQLHANLRQLHSSEYHNPFELPDGPVLVAGAGNSGAQIALELARHRKVWLAGRDTGHLPRRLLGRDFFEWTWPLMRHATASTPIGRRMRARVHRGDPLIGIPERVLRQSGVERVGKVDEVRNGLPVCAGTVVDPAVVIWCTGFRPDYSWIDLPVFGPDGHPRHTRGVAADAPGLYFVGLRFQHRLNSTLIGGVGDDAAYVTARVLERAEQCVLDADQLQPG